MLVKLLMWFNLKEKATTKFDVKDRLTAVPSHTYTMTVAVVIYFFSFLAFDCYHYFFLIHDELKNKVLSSLTDHSDLLGVAR